MYFYETMCVLPGLNMYTFHGQFPTYFDIGIFAIFRVDNVCDVMLLFLLPSIFLKCILALR
jgi:hypothetical protein